MAAGVGPGGEARGGGLPARDPAGVGDTGDGYEVTRAKASTKAATFDESDYEHESRAVPFLILVLVVLLFPLPIAHVIGSPAVRDRRASPTGETLLRRVADFATALAE